MSRYTQFQENQFRQSVSKALQTVEKILDSERHPVIAEDEPHKYQDKYELSEFLTNTAIAAQMNAWTALGLQPDQQKTVLDWVAKKQEVTLRFMAEDSCSFLKEQVVEVKQYPHGSDLVVTQEKSGLFGKSTETVTTSVKRKVKEYHWKIRLYHKVIVFPGTAAGPDSICLQQRRTETVLVTQSNQQKAPFPEVTVHPPVDASLTWFLQQISNTAECQFTIDRDSSTTPRRNPDVARALKSHREIFDWARVTQRFFLQRIEREMMGKDNPAEPPQATGILETGSTATIQGLMKEPAFNGVKVRIVEFQNQRYKVEPLDPHAGLPTSLSIKPGNIQPDQQPLTGPPLHSITTQSLFAPILPLMEDGTVVSVSELLQEQSRSVDEALEGLGRMYPARTLVRLVSVAEASLVLLCKHVEQLAKQYSDAVDYIEAMLQQQLVAAIGKKVARSDFEQFMRHHYPKLFGQDFAPLPFCRAIRRPNCYPDGIISLEEVSSPEAPPVATFCRAIRGEEAPPMFCPIHAAASIELTGDRYLHGWMQHRFGSEAAPTFQLACRARQFSSFLVVLGTIAGANKLEPKDAIILHNKDEVLIPLLTDPLPSAKEFRDAIESLSPEQQEFAKAYRGMQLESSVFGVCVIQVKPQLETLLGLPGGALTKEIQLTQDLMKLFVDYQVPSDMLTYDGDSGSSSSDKVAAVKGHVKSVMDVIDTSKKKQLQEETMKADMRTEMEHTGEEEEIDEEDFEAYAVASHIGNRDARGRGGGGSVVKKMRRKMSRKPLAGQAVASFGGAAPPRGRMMVESRADFCMAPETTYRSTPQPPAPASIVQVRQPPRKEAPPPKQTPVSSAPSAAGGNDFTLIPKALDAALEKLDTDGALRSTVIKASDLWTRRRQENFLVVAAVSSLSADDISLEKKKAFDLLDAISRSGTLPIACSELHVFVAVSHCFEKNVMGSIIEDNVNPIAKVERSALLLASTIYGQPAASLLSNGTEVQRLTTSFPLLFDADEDRPNTGQQIM